MEQSTINQQNNLEGNLSLYVHIPFCVRKCNYCDFLSAPGDEKTKTNYITALISEIDWWEKNLFSDIKKENLNINTIFIGGGTPSCIPVSQLERLGKRINELVEKSGSSVEEYTVEVNPGTVTEQMAAVMKRMGVGRVSIGLQSAEDSELKKLGRIHSFSDFLDSYNILRQADFDNINIDLMCDIPGQTMESYMKTLQRVADLKPEHISAYSLIIEPGTRFYEMYEAGELVIPDEDTEREMYSRTKSYLWERGYHRYEISNYSLAGMECRHNLTYWETGNYLGLGVGAASYVGGCRFSNTSDMEKYIGTYRDIPYMDSSQSDWDIEKKLRKIAVCSEDFEVLTAKQQMEEYMFLGLRKCDGISKEEFTKRFGVDFNQIYGDVIKKHLSQGLLAIDEISGKIKLTDRGIDVSNYVLSDFLLD